MKAIEIIAKTDMEIREAEGDKDITWEPQAHELIEEFEKEIVSWEYYSSDGDLNFYNEDDDLVVSLRIEEDEDGNLFVTGAEDR
ncbi:MAG: hypothetical protein EOL88_08885 [Bacteroidia bacterium]|nr:hypothetical protein [Bacteroidia bacterium]